MKEKKIKDTKNTNIEIDEFSIKKVIKNMDVKKAKEYLILSTIFGKPKGLKKKWW